jgi:hypothetical protein
MSATIHSTERTARLRVCVVNGVFVSGGLGEDGRVRPPGLMTTFAQTITAETGHRAWALWPYRSKLEFSIAAFATVTRRKVHDYASYLAECIDEDLRADPLAPDESLAFVAYSGGTPVTQIAATLLRARYPVRSFVFFGPALLPHMIPGDWCGDATVGCILGTRDWVQGVFPRVPRPWQQECPPAIRRRIMGHLPRVTEYRMLACAHWPGYFARETWPDLMREVRELLPPAPALGRPLAAR